MVPVSFRCARYNRPLSALLTSTSTVKLVLSDEQACINSKESCEKVNDAHISEIEVPNLYFSLNI